MKVKLLAAAIAATLSASNVWALSGKVVDTSGNPIAGATVEVIGQLDNWQSGADGSFDIPLDNIDEIHVEAEGYSHKVMHLHGEAEDPLNIVLFTSVLNVVDVVGVPIHASKIESAQPVSVLAGENLRKKQADTLGDILKYEVGVQSSYFGGAASSPVIRGLDGPRVLITQNGLDVSDASRVGPDHVVAAEGSTAEQIEILRGPATLFFGSGAIGGVVNVVDGRVPKDSEQKGELFTEYQSVNDQTSISGSYTGGNESMAFHVDGFWRDGDDYDIPGLAELEEEGHEEEEHEEEEGTLENSAAETKGFNIGASLLLDNGFVGLSYGRLDRVNGIPGHGHGEEEEEEGGEPEAEEEEEIVMSDLKQNRWQLLSELQLEGGFFSGVDTRIGYTDYEHVEIEIEDGEAFQGTTFKNTTLQARVDLSHEERLGWKGAISLETKMVDFEAIGEEAFTPPSQTDELALAIIEERHVGDLLWQVGARLERVTLNADDLEIGHGHEEDEGSEEEEEIIQFEELDFTPFSVSAGLVWDFTPGYNIGLSIAHAERAPNAAEIFSAGPHIATRTFEVGALFDIEFEDDEYHLELVGGAEKETSNNIDLSLRKFSGDFGFVINIFYNQISDYYGLFDTGITSEDLFPEDEDEMMAMDPEEEHGHEEAVLPVFIFDQNDANFSGLEMEFVWRFHPNFTWTIWGDTVHAELDDGPYIPRTSPTRFANQLNFEQGRWNGEISAVNYFDQDKPAFNETSTDGYTMVDARVSYTLPTTGGEAQFYLGITNATDEDARVHTSFLKNQAPLPGRNIKLGGRIQF